MKRADERVALQRRGKHDGAPKPWQRCFEFRAAEVVIAIDRSAGAIGVAICSPADQYDRRLGKRIALGRAEAVWRAGRSAPRHTETSRSFDLTADLGRVEEELASMGRQAPRPALLDFLATLDLVPGCELYWPTGKAAE